MNPIDKPTYAPLLNSIAVNEAKGQRLFSAWAHATADAQLRSVLEFVAIREGEHAMAFTKRLCELGCEVDDESAYPFFDDFDGLLACAASDASDAEKVGMLTGGDSGEAQGTDPFRGFFNDRSIDPQTGALLGRFIAEERDSTRRLKAEYERVCADGAVPLGQAGATATPDEFAELRTCIAELRADVAKLAKKVRKLKRA
jgi:hypothetical protein